MYLSLKITSFLTTFPNFLKGATIYQKAHPDFLKFMNFMKSTLEYSQITWESQRINTCLKTLKGSKEWLTINSVDSKSSKREKLTDEMLKFLVLMSRSKTKCSIVASWSRFRKVLRIQLISPTYHLSMLSMQTNLSFYITLMRISQKIFLNFQGYFKKYPLTNLLISF